MSTNADSYALFYDGTCGMCRKLAQLLPRICRRAKITLIDASVPAALAPYPRISPEQAMQSVHLITPDGKLLRGYDAVVAVTGLIPVVRGLVPLMATRLARRVGWALYEWVTAHRHQISHALFLE